MGRQAQISLRSKRSACDFECIVQADTVFIIGDVINKLLNGEKNFSVYLIEIAMIAASFVIAEIFHSISTAFSHKATFSVLGQIRKETCDKLSRVPLGYVKDTSSGTLKNIMVERIDSIETTLAHILPEFTSNLIPPVAVLVYLFVIDWRMALLSLVIVVLGFCSTFGMFIGYEENFKNAVEKTKVLNNAAVEYINGIEVIKVFGKADSSYENSQKPLKREQRRISAGCANAVFTIAFRLFLPRTHFSPFCRLAQCLF